jgi:predicted RNA-binding Zn ribbon-like protein
VDVFSLAADAVVSIVNAGIGDASERAAVVVDPDAGPLWFMADPQTPDLLTFVYLQLQTLVTGLVPLRTCADPECGRSFTPDDPRARYCQPAHGNRTRARRSRRRVTAGEGDNPETRA